MSTQPQRNAALKKEQPDVSTDFQCLMNCSAVGLDVFNDPSFAATLRLIVMKLFCAPCSSDASESLQPVTPDHEVYEVTSVSQYTGEASFCEV